MGITIALLFNNYGPYHLARLKASYEASQARDWELVGLELSRFQNEYPWHIDTDQTEASVISVIADKPLEQVGMATLLSALYRTLNQINPTVVAIPGYYNLAWLGVLLWCRVNQKSTILMSETKADDAPRGFWSELLKRTILKFYSSALVGGKLHHSYFRSLGMKSEQIFLGYDIVENDSFHPNKIRLLPRPFSSPYFLAINRFIPKKNLFQLISAFAAYQQIAGEDAWHLVLCGDGELRVQIEQRIRSLHLQNLVHLPGFLQQDELLPYFAHAGCFVHASLTEQWGLVINEAMAAGLPVLVSNRCGCYEDLIIEGINGFGFDPENQEQLTQLMLKVSSGEIDLGRMGRAALNHIQKFSPGYFAQGLMQATEYALVSRQRS